MSVKTETIRVWIYHSGGSILHPIGEDEEPKYWDVEAHCVGGDCGVFAVFRHPEKETLVCYAQGDDGHWWFAGCMGEGWTKDYITAFTKTLDK